MWLFQVDPDNSLNQLVVLNTDMILAFPIDYSGPYNVGLTYEQQFPNDGQTCEPFLNDELFTEVLSGPSFTPLCRANREGKILFSNQSTPSYTQVLRYINVTSGNLAFLNDFAVSYAKMMSVGYGPGGKLGMLTPIDLSTCSFAGQDSSPQSAKTTSSSQKASPLISLVVLILLPIGAALIYYFIVRPPAKSATLIGRPVPAEEPGDVATV